MEAEVLSLSHRALAELLLSSAGFQKSLSQSYCACALLNYKMYRSENRGGAENDFDGKSERSHSKNYGVEKPEISTKDTAYTKGSYEEKGSVNSNSSSKKNKDRDFDRHFGRASLDSSEPSLSTIREEPSNLDNQSSRKSMTYVEPENALNLDLFLDYLEEALKNRLQGTVAEAKMALQNIPDPESRAFMQTFTNFITSAQAKASNSIPRLIDKYEEYAGGLVSYHDRYTSFRPTTTNASEVNFLNGNPASVQYLDKFKDAIYSELDRMKQKRLERIVQNFEGQLRTNNKNLIDRLGSKIKGSDGDNAKKEDTIKYIHQKNQLDNEFIFEMETCIESLKNRVEKLL
jgi:hypothetical protein